MADDVLKTAQTLRDTIAKQLDAARAQVRSLEAQLAHADALIEQAGGEIAHMSQALSQSRPNPSRHQVMRVVVDIIAREGRPMQLRELNEAVQANGIALTGKDPSSVLGTMLWRGGRDGVLVNLPRYGYWPADKPYAPAGYEPRER